MFHWLMKEPQGLLIPCQSLQVVINSAFCIGSDSCPGTVFLSWFRSPQAVGSSLIGLVNKKHFTTSFPTHFKDLLSASPPPTPARQARYLESSLTVSDLEKAVKPAITAVSLFLNCLQGNSGCTLFRP